MEELKILIEAIAGLPDLAIWVVAMFFVFKVVVVGSIYGVIRFVSQKIHDMVTFKKITVKDESVVLKLGNQIITTDSTPEILQSLLSRLKSTNYIHSNDIEWCLNALDYYEAAEGTNRYQTKQYKEK